MRYHQNQFNMQTLDFKQMGLTPMSETEMSSLVGGGVLSKVLKWAGQQLAEWGFANALDAAYDHMKKNPPQKVPDNVKSYLPAGVRM